MDDIKIIKAGKIAAKVKKYARELIKPNMPLYDIAEKIEAKIIELGGKPAFPVNLSINNIAAHYTPLHEDKATAIGLLKVDLGVHVDGWTADTAFSLDLENSKENKELIEASEEALKNAEKIFKEKTSLQEIGKTIEKTIQEKGFTPIVNLSGHEMKQYELHSGVTVPNISNSKPHILKKGLYAIEPFASTGTGRVHDGKPSGIYMIQSLSPQPRNPEAREVLEKINEEYKTLPFCSRWLVKKFGSKILFSLKRLEENGNLHNFAQLVEVEGSKVSQTENTVLISDKVSVTTEDLVL